MAGFDFTGLDFSAVFFAVFGFAALAAALVTFVVTVFALPATGFLAAAVILDLVAALGLLPAAADARLRVVVFAMADPPLQTPEFGRFGNSAESGSVYRDSG
jgi:hypothetical protein